MPKEWNDEEVAELIKENVEIVRQDRLETFLRSRFAPTDNDKNDSKDAPPSSGNGNSNDPTAPKTKKSLFWGETD